MTGSSLYFWRAFVQMKYSQAKAAIQRSKRLRGFLINAIIAYACIGGHQVGEFFAIWSGDQTIYKLGLISSIMSIFFGARAIEKLTKQSIGSWLVLGAIGLVSLDIMLTTFDFSNRHFWIRGENHYNWSTAWFTLWVYVIISGLYLSRFYQTATNKKLLRWAFIGVMNVSFIFSMFYAVLGNLSTAYVACTQDLFAGFVFGKDFPSIWCTFSAIQAPFVYLGLRAFVNNYDVKDAEIKPAMGFWKRTIIFALLTLAIMVLLKQAVPLVFEVSLKMITK